MSTITVEDTTSQDVSSAWRRWRRIEGIGAWIALAVVTALGALIVAVQTDNNLLTRANLDIVLVTAVPLGLVGIGQTLAILVGHFDLSVAGMVSLSVVLTAKLMDGVSSNIPIALGVTLLVGCVIGILNGLIVTKLHVNALIATLGTSLMIDGALNTLVTSRSGSVSEGFRELGYGEWLTIPNGVFLLAVVAAGAIVMLSRSSLGHHFYAVGGNAESARMSGIRADGVVIVAFAMSALCAALAGIYLASRLGAGDPGVGARGGYALDSVAIVVLGGTALGGGRGGVFGTIGGLLLFSLLDTVFNLLQIDSFLKSMLQGAIIIVAVASYSIRSGRTAG